MRHPGESFNCRCEAVPYVPGETEFAFHDFTTRLSSAEDRWRIPDFVRHYYHGEGRAVTLREIGRLREIAEYYAFNEGVEGAFRRLSGQISQAACEEGPGLFTYNFDEVYDFESVASSHGDPTEGIFIGGATERGDMLMVRGVTIYRFRDDFADPLDMGVEPGGVLYQISGIWTARGCYGLAVMWSAPKKVVLPEVGFRADWRTLEWRRRNTSPKRSSRSCGRSMSLFRKNGPSRRRSARSA